MPTADPELRVLAERPARGSTAAERVAERAPADGVPAAGVPLSPAAGVAPSAPSPPAPRRAPLRRAAEYVALAMLLAVGVEAACRVEDWVQYRTPFFARERSQADLMVWDADGAHGRPSARFQKWRMNALGMRGPEVAARTAPGTLRVVTAGASETFGLYESPDREYPRQLEDSLRAAVARCAPAGVRRVEVLNAALPGMSLPTVEQDVRLRLPRVAPDVVVLYPTPVGYLDERLPIAATPDSSGRPHELPLRNAWHPRVGARIRSQVRLLLPDAIADALRRREIEARVAREAAGWRFRAVPEDRLAAYERDVRRAVGAARAIGAQPVLLTHANRFGRAGAEERDAVVLRAWERFYPRATGRTLVAFDSAARAVTLRVARDSQITAVDLAPAAAAKPPEQVFADFSHFTDAGAALVARVAAPAVLQAAGVACTPDARRPGA